VRDDRRDAILHETCCILLGLNEDLVRRSHALKRFVPVVESVNRIAVIWGIADMYEVSGVVCVVVSYRQTGSSGSILRDEAT
jgi:hypothetical protein